MVVLAPQGNVCPCLPHGPQREGWGAITWPSLFPAPDPGLQQSWRLLHSIGALHGRAHPRRCAHRTLPEFALSNTPSPAPRPPPPLRPARPSPVAVQGRTGLVICCFLLYSGLCETATLALNKYGEARTQNNKGVTIASQIRYVYYFSQLLRSVPAPVEATYKIRHIRLITVPNFDVVRVRCAASLPPSAPRACARACPWLPATSGVGLLPVPLRGSCLTTGPYARAVLCRVQGGGCDPFFDVRIRSSRTNKMKKVFDYKDAVKKIKNYKSKDKYVDLDCESMNIVIRGDVKILFWDYDRMSPPDKVRRGGGQGAARSTSTPSRPHAGAARPLACGVTCTRAFCDCFSVRQAGAAFGAVGGRLPRRVPLFLSDAAVCRVVFAGMQDSCVAPPTFVSLSFSLSLSLRICVYLRARWPCPVVPRPHRCSTFG